MLATGGTVLTTTTRKRASLVGSEDYVAPEILAGSPSGPAADLWTGSPHISLLVRGLSVQRYKRTGILSENLRGRLPIQR